MLPTLAPCLASLIVACMPFSAAAADADDAAISIPRVESSLSPEVQRRVAERFSPILEFHPLEEYFPTSPLFTLPAGDTRSADDPATIALLGTADSRRERYEALALTEKAALATVYYRAYPVRRDSRDLIVVEYWFYYVQNAYRIRGNVLPFWVNGNHPNDLEHVHVVLRPSGDSEEFVLDGVYASAHEGTMPANRYHYANGDPQKRARYLVERGSHALAPDIDEDGVFTPGVDGDSGQKFLWGIRDRGVIWPRYNPEYMDDRRKDSPIVFEHAGAPTAGMGWLPYRLVPVEELTQAFAQLDLSSKQRQAVFEIDKNWFRRAFGGDNGSSEKLLVPPTRAASSGSVGIRQFSSTERGLLLGYTFKNDRQGMMIGGRYSYLHGIRHLPDLIFESTAHVTTYGTAYVSNEVLLSYPIDGTVRARFGGALVVDSLTFESPQLDFVLGAEVKLGRMRVNAATRSFGRITRSSKEFSLSYFF